MDNYEAMIGFSQDASNNATDVKLSSGDEVEEKLHEQFKFWKVDVSQGQNHKFALN